MLLPILTIALFLVQAVAFFEGVEAWLGIHPAWGILAFPLLLLFGPYVGIPMAVTAYMGATEGWGWPWWQAAIVAFPAVVAAIALAVAAGGVSLLEALRRRG